MTKQTNTYPVTHRITGFTLLEVMIALLVFSIGLLGLAGLQGSSLQNNKTADLRSIAIIAAHDMAERIRANERGTSGDYNAITTPAGPLSAPSPDCITSACTTPAQLAAEDNYEWQTSLSTLLPSGQGSVTLTANGPIEITVMWDEAHTGTTLKDCSATALKCYKLDFLP